MDPMVHPQGVSKTRGRPPPEVQARRVEPHPSSSGAMSESSAPPPGPAPPGRKPEPVVLELGGAGSGGVRRLVSTRKAEGRMSLTPQEIVVEHAGSLRAPLRFAPGSV